MPGKRILSDAQLVEMAELREQGWKYHRISRHFAKAGTAISVNALHWQCLRMGADVPPEQRRSGQQRDLPYRRGGHIVRPFLPDDDALLRQLDMEGVNACEIGRRLGRKQNSIRGRLMTLARRDARAEEAGA